jgi:hypothetical protein
MTANNPPAHTHRVLLVPEQKKIIKSWDISKNSDGVIA